MQELVSVIIPVYNSESTIDRCVKSVVNQTYNNVQVILVDDGSNKDCAKKCDDLASEGNNIEVYHFDNAGVSVARNRGLELAKGEYITFVDSDDYVDSNYIKTLIETIDKTKTEMVIGGFCWVKNDLKREFLYSKNTEEILSRKDFFRIQRAWLINAPWGKLYKKEIVEENFVRMNEKISLGEDLLFNIDYLQAIGEKSIAIVNKALYFYDVSNESSLDRKYRPDRLDNIRYLNKEIFNRCSTWDGIEWTLYYAYALHQIEECMRNTMKAGKDISFFEKIRINNGILRSEEYKTYLRKAGGAVTKIKKLCQRPIIV